MGRRAAPTELTPELKQFIAECDARKANLELSVQEVAYRTKLGEGWVRRFFKGGEVNPTVTSLVILARALDLNFCLAVVPKPGSYDEKAVSLFTERILAQLVPARQDGESQLVG